MQRKVNRAEKEFTQNSTGISKDKHLSKKSSRSLSYSTCRLCLVFLLFVAAIFLYFVLTRLGFGDKFPQQQLEKMKPILSERELEIIAVLDTPPGNIAVSGAGRVFFNFHPEYNPQPIKIAELVNKTSWEPFPNLDFQNQIVSCLSMRIDSKNRLWLLDFAQHGTVGTPKLLGIQLDTAKSSKEHVVFSYDFPRDVAGFGSMLNDFVVDPKGQFIYIADTSIVAGTPALVVFSISEKRSYRLLSSHSSMFGQPFTFSVGGLPVHWGPLAVKVWLHFDESIIHSKIHNHTYMHA